VGRGAGHRLISETVALTQIWRARADSETREVECCTAVTSEELGDRRWHGRADGASATN